MSRVEVTATITTNNEGAPVLNLKGKGVDESYQKYDKLTIPGSIGAFFVAPHPEIPTVWGVWRISGSEKRRYDSEDWWQIVTRAMKEGVVSTARNGERYLFATSAGSAQRGVLHPMPRYNQTPLQALLRRRGISPGKTIVRKYNATEVVMQDGHYGYANCPVGPRQAPLWVNHDGQEIDRFDEEVIKPRNGHFSGHRIWKIRVRGASYAVFTRGASRSHPNSEGIERIELYSPEGEEAVYKYLLTH